jgi:hypothetical protein
VFLTGKPNTNVKTHDLIPNLKDHD